MNSHQKAQGVTHCRNHEYALAMKVLQEAVTADSEDWETRYWYALAIRGWALEQYEKGLTEHDVDINHLRIPDEPTEAITALPRLLSEVRSVALSTKNDKSTFTQLKRSQLMGHAMSFHLVCVKTLAVFRTFDYDDNLNEAFSRNRQYPPLQDLRAEYDAMIQALELAKTIELHDTKTIELHDTPKAGCLQYAGAGLVLLALTAVCQNLLRTPSRNQTASSASVGTGSNNNALRTIGSFQASVPNSWSGPVHAHRPADSVDLYTLTAPEGDAFARVEQRKIRSQALNGNSLELVSRYPRETHAKFANQPSTFQYKLIDMHTALLFENPAYVWEFERNVKDRGLRRRRIVYFTGTAYGGAILFESAASSWHRFESDFRSLEESLVEIPQ